MRLVMRLIVRTGAAGHESGTAVGSKPTRHFNAYLSRYRDRADHESDQLPTPKRATKIDFRGTDLLPMAHGQAKVESKKGYIEIEVEFDELQPATKYGAEYLTYVLWAITPEGRTSNLGEIL